MKKYGALFVLVAALGCSSDTTITVPENATAEAPDESASTGGESEAAKGPGEQHSLKPRK